MTWEAIGAIGELVSALAVLGTLIYLAIQVRHNSQQVWSQNVHSRTNQSHKVAEFQSSPHITAALLKAMNDETLSKQESIYMESYASMALSLYANQFDHVRAGITVSNWKNSRRLISHYMAIPEIRKWWLEVGNLSQNSDFAREVESIIKEYPIDADQVNKIYDSDT